MFQGYSALIISVHHTVTHRDYLDIKSDNANAIQHFLINSDKENSSEELFESAIISKNNNNNNNNSNNNRSRDNHNNNNNSSSDFHINSLTFPPGGSDRLLQTDLFGNLLFRASKSTPRMTKKSLLITSLFFFY